MDIYYLYSHVYSSGPHTLSGLLISVLPISNLTKIPKIIAALLYLVLFNILCPVVVYMFDVDIL